MRYALVNMTLLDGTLDPETGQMVRQLNKAVLVKDGLFEAIVAERDLDPLCPREDLHGGYLMPGLINLHAHLVISGGVPKSDKPTDYRKLVQTLKPLPPVRWVFSRSELKNAENELLSGVTTLRSVGGIDDWDGRARDAVESWKHPGARIYSANTAISVTGGHFAGSLATESDTPEQALADVRNVIATKPDLVKLMITGGVMDATKLGEPGVLRMSPEIANATVAEAHRHHLPTAAHVESSEGVRVALEAGVDTIEHGAPIEDYDVKLFKHNKSALVATFSPAVPYVYLPLEQAKCSEMAHTNGTVVLERFIDCVARCLAEGIPVGMGTDAGCPFITHYDMWRELVYFQHFCGVSTDFTLHTATQVNAEILHAQGALGTIERGKCADFIVCQQNPLADLTRLRNLTVVAREGRIIRNPKPNRDAAVERALDQAMAAVFFG